jgi:uncharacterized protein YndB with AHSA1/START domain
MMTPQETVYVTYIVTTPEKLWAALTDPAFTRQYFFGRRIESDWQAGSQVTYRMEDGQADVQGKILESDPPRRLSFTWNVVRMEEYRHLPECIVTFQIDPLGDLVRLTMIESHPTPIDEKYLEGGRRGWPVILSGLKSLLETGRPLPKFDMAA